MKLLIQIFAVLAALTSFALADDKSVCAGKNKHVMNAIQNFCTSYTLASLRLLKTHNGR